MVETTFTYKRDECTVLIERVFDAPRETWQRLAELLAVVQREDVVAT
jgi:hypothetical protein